MTADTPATTTPEQDRFLQAAHASAKTARLAGIELCRASAGENFDHQPIARFAAIIRELWTARTSPYELVPEQIAVKALQEAGILEIRVNSEPNGTRFERVDANEVRRLLFEVVDRLETIGKSDNLGDIYIGDLIEFSVVFYRRMSRWLERQEQRS